VGRSALIQPYAWSRYSRKLAARIERPRWLGLFTADDARDRGVRLVTGFDGSIDEGNAVRIYWLVDETDGVVADAKFQVFGQSALIGAADAACELCMGKNYDQAGRISADLLDKHLRDKENQPAFPAETTPHLNLALGAVADAAAQCVDLPLPETYVTPTLDIEAIEGGIPGFMEMPHGKKVALIKEVIADQIRPYIELDAGGIDVLDLVGNEVKIAYSGSCTSCHAATGSTLSAVQGVIQARVHPDLTVVPDLAISEQS